MSRRITPLVELPGLGFVKSFALDYMHLVSLGVMRTIIVAWLSGLKSSEKGTSSKAERDLILLKIPMEVC